MLIGTQDIQKMAEFNSKQSSNNAQNRPEIYCEGYVDGFNDGRKPSLLGAEDVDLLRKTNEFLAKRSQWNEDDVRMAYLTGRMLILGHEKFTIDQVPKEIISDCAKYLKKKKKKKI